MAQQNKKNSPIEKIQHLIKKNFSQELSLTELAKHAFLSPFHFQRRFKESTGESPKQYLSRVRLEAAAHSLVTDPELSILTVALDCGYNSPEHFSRAFKKAYGLSPKQFKELDEDEKIRSLQATSGRSDIDFSAFDQVSLTSVNPREMDIQVVKMPKLQLIAMATNLASMPRIEAQFQHLQTWAKARELINNETQWMGLVMDYPLFTELEKCHYMVAMSCAESVALSAELQRVEVAAATYASVPVQLAINDMLQDMTRFWKLWLPQSGYRMKHDTALHLPTLDIEKVPYTQNQFRLLIQIEPA